MDDSLQELAQLKALHLPDSVSQLPLAPGWWVLLAAVIFSVYFIVKIVTASIKKNAYRRVALSQLAVIFSDHEREKDDYKLLKQVNGLLKRVAIQQYPNSQCAPMHDEQWQMFLKSAVSNKKQLNCEVFKCFADLYKKDVTLDAQQRQQLLQVSQKWLGNHHKIVNDSESDRKEMKGV